MKNENIIKLIYVVIAFCLFTFIIIFYSKQEPCNNSAIETTTEIITEETTFQESTFQETTTQNNNDKETTTDNDHSIFIQPVETKENPSGFIISCHSYNDIEEGKQNIEIKYPQIENMPNKKLKDKINKKLYEKAFSFLNKSDDIENLMYSQFYSITTFDRDILSIYFELSCYYRGSMYPFSDCYSLNIDLATGEEIKLFDLIDEEQLLSLGEKNAFKAVKYVGNFEEAFSYKSLIEEFLTYSNKEDYFYINDKKIALFIPMSHGGGDFAIIETKDNVIK